jgi:hypothetical protein
MVEKRTTFKKIYRPPGFALGVWLGLNFLTDHLEWFGTGAAYRTAAFLLYLFLGLLIFFAAPAVYAAMRIRGASFKERVLGAYLVPALWVLKEIWRVSGFFSWGESFYYALSPIPFAVLTYQVGTLCLVEMVFRFRKRGPDPFPPILSPGPILGLGFFALVVYLTLFWGLPAESPGTKCFYLYQEGYKALFGGPGRG